MLTCFKNASNPWCIDLFLTNWFDFDFLISCWFRYSIYGTSTDQIDTTDIQESILTAIDKYKSHAGILKYTLEK